MALHSPAQMHHHRWFSGAVGCVPCNVCCVLLSSSVSRQPRSAWCVTRCVQAQGAGVQALTSASPANTSAADERAWTGAIYTRGESRLGTSRTDTLMDDWRIKFLVIFQHFYIYFLESFCKESGQCDQPLLKSDEPEHLNIQMAAYDLGHKDRHRQKVLIYSCHLGHQQENQSSLKPQDQALTGKNLEQDQADVGKPSCC